jgi:hypothetical protein
MAAIAASSPATAFAAEWSDNVWTRSWQRGAIVFAAVLFGIYLSGALFIHFAAGVTKLENRSFGRALKAALVTWLLAQIMAFLVGFGFGLFDMHTTGAVLAGVALVILLPGTLAIRNYYEAGFVTSLITFVIAVLLWVGAVLGIEYALGVLPA